MSKGKKFSSFNKAVPIDAQERKLFFDAINATDDELGELPSSSDETCPREHLSEDDESLFLNAVDGDFSSTSSTSTSSDASIGFLSSRKKSKKNKIEAMLDLHGLRRHQAVVSLNEFIAQAISKGQKKLLVIHGRGSGALKKEVGDYLNRDDRVMSLQPAPGRMGGEGALLIRLR